MANLIEGAIEITQRALTWQRSTQMCSIESHTYLYVLIVCWFLIAGCGVYAWHRFIKSKPKQMAV